MGKNNNGNSSTIVTILRSEVTFWLTIITLVVSIVVVFTKLESKVGAMEDKGITLRKDYESSKELLIEVRESQIRMEKDVEYIKTQLK